MVPDRWETVWLTLVFFGFLLHIAAVHKMSNHDDKGQRYHALIMD